MFPQSLHLRAGGWLGGKKGRPPEFPQRGQEAPTLMLPDLESALLGLSSIMGEPVL